ncbi:hypothetical protein FB446DRAFT_142249 [Lentinula raphanica]|nr:hypothetical protein FB446DRAFT_142249 [Lentinula raphanica]
MFPRTSIKLSSASFVRLLLAVSFVLWSLGIAKASVDQYASVNPVGSEQPIVQTSCEVVVHVLNGATRGNIDSFISMSIGDQYLTIYGLSEGLSRPSNQLATTKGPGSKQIGFVHAPSLQEIHERVRAVHQEVQYIEHETAIEYFKVFLDKVRERIPSDRGIDRNWQLMKANLVRGLQ